MQTPRVEALEVRRLFVAGTAGNDVIEVERVGEDPFTYRAIVNGVEVERRTLKPGSLVSVTARGGDDTVTLDTSLDLEFNVLGGDGNDTIVGGSQGDRLRGNAGDDLIFGKTGPDMIYGGAGNDTLRGGQSLDELFGDDGDVTATTGGDDMLFGEGEDDILTGDGGSSVSRT